MGRLFFMEGILVNFHSSIFSLFIINVMNYKTNGKMGKSISSENSSTYKSKFRNQS